MSRNIKNFSREREREMEQLKRGERERRREEARDTMWTEGAEVIQTSGNGENETKEGYIYIYAEGTTGSVPPSVQSNYSRRVAVAECVRDLWLVFAAKRLHLSVRCLSKQRYTRNSFSINFATPFFHSSTAYSFHQRSCWLPCDRHLSFLPLPCGISTEKQGGSWHGFIPSFLSTFGWRISRNGKNEMKRNGKGWRCSRFFFWIE